MSLYRAVEVVRIVFGPRLGGHLEWSPGSLLAETTTLAPLSANRSAASRQMPLEAPISTTTCSSIGFNCIAFPFRLRACRGRLVKLSVVEEIA
jgi:hypothetical protein